MTADQLNAAVKKFSLVAVALVILLAPVASKAQILYVASEYSSSVSAFNAITGATISQSFITGLTDPTSLAVSGSTLSDWDLDVSTARWVSTATYKVPIEYGSST